jgi:hypothetical protein
VKYAFIQCRYNDFIYVMIKYGINNNKLTQHISNENIDSYGQPVGLGRVCHTRYSPYYTDRKEKRMSYMVYFHIYYEKFDIRWLFFNQIN